MTASTPETLADLVKTNYFALTNSGKLDPDRLKDLAFGQEPTTAELAIIANVLDVAEEFVVELRDRNSLSQSKKQ
jgi:plasmid maintenance system antidote protein VapI